MRSERPEWFTAPPYSKLRVPDDVADEWIAMVRDHWAETSSSRPDLERIWTHLSRAEEMLAERARATDWTKMSAWFVTLALHSAFDLELGIRTFLPPRFDDLSDGVRRWLFTYLLLLHSPIADRRLADGLLPLGRALYWRQGGPFALREIQRRMQGTTVGPLGVVLVAASEEIGGETPALTADLEDAFRNLRALAGKQKGIQGALRSLTSHEPPERRRAVQDAEVNAAIWTGLVERGGTDVAEALARAIGREIEALPMAVRDDLIDRFRAENRRQKRGEHYRQPDQFRGWEPGDPATDRAAREFNTLHVEFVEGLPDDEELTADLIKQLDSDPRTRPLVEGFMPTLGDESPIPGQEDLASFLGVDRKTWRRIRDRLRENPPD